MKKSYRDKRQCGIQDPAERKSIGEDFEKYLQRRYSRQKESADDFIKNLVNSFVNALDEEQPDPAFCNLLLKR